MSLWSQTVVTVFIFLFKLSLTTCCFFLSKDVLKRWMCQLQAESVADGHFLAKLKFVCSQGLQFNQQHRKSFMHDAFQPKILYSWILPLPFKTPSSHDMFTLGDAAWCVWSFTCNYFIRFSKPAGLVSLIECKDVLSETICQGLSDLELLPGSDQV